MGGTEDVAKDSGRVCVAGAENIEKIFEQGEDVIMRDTCHRDERLIVT